MKISATIEMPKKRNPRKIRYIRPRRPVGKRVVPGIRTIPLKQRIKG